MLLTAVRLIRGRPLKPEYQLKLVTRSDEASAICHVVVGISKQPEP